MGKKLSNKEIYTEEWKKEQLELCDSMRGGPQIRALKAQVKALEAKRDRFKQREIELSQGWKRLHSENEDLRSRLAEAENLFKEACIGDNQCGIALLNDSDCSKCDWYPLWKVIHREAEG